MKIVNKELERMVEKSDGNMTVLSIRKIDRLITLIKLNPGNIKYCTKIVAKEFNTTSRAITQLYYDKYKNELDIFIRVVSEYTQTSGNTKNDLSLKFEYVMTHS